MANKEDWKSEMYGDEVREKLLEFAETGFESIPEDESGTRGSPGSSSGECSTSARAKRATS